VAEVFAVFGTALAEHGRDHVYRQSPWWDPVVCLSAPRAATSPARHITATTKGTVVMPTAGTPQASRRLFTGWHISTHDGCSHAVTGAVLAEGVRQQRDQFETICGLRIYPAAVAAPCGRPCSRCITLLIDNGLRRRFRWLRRPSGRHARGARA
jgi:hypothetical protein